MTGKSIEKALRRRASLWTVVAVVASVAVLVLTSSRTLLDPIGDWRLSQALIAYGALAATSLIIFWASMAWEDLRYYLEYRPESPHAK